MMIMQEGTLAGIAGIQAAAAAAVPVPAAPSAPMSALPSEPEVVIVTPIELPSNSPVQSPQSSVGTGSPSRGKPRASPFFLRFLILLTSLQMRNLSYHQLPQNKLISLSRASFQIHNCRCRWTKALLS